MLKVFTLVFVLTSCAYLGLVKFNSNKQGLKDAIVYNKTKLHDCSEKRPPWHSSLSYKVKLSVLINKDGTVEKLYVQSYPTLSSSMQKCIVDSFEKTKFTKVDRAIRVSQIFKIKSLL